MDTVNKISTINRINNDHENININDLLECIKFIINYILSQKSNKNKHSKYKKDFYSQIVTLQKIIKKFEKWKNKIYGRS